MTETNTAVRQMRHDLARAPLPVVRRHPGKSWAGALVSNLDDAFGLGRLGRGRSYMDAADDATAALRGCNCDV